MAVAVLLEEGNGREGLGLYNDARGRSLGARDEEILTCCHAWRLASGEYGPNRWAPPVSDTRRSGARVGLRASEVSRPAQLGRSDSFFFVVLSFSFFSFFVFLL
ncbi:hypothetical protein BRADI_3g25644v3 [Brachypodium distachyon]|uniref:Uncharacterized protein n=1 Tax=Brachypodium distachyon TaxID=15368 RepID=A0A2K2CZ97_BRADI|nr:hypothetical protein BRADI_3g25644v3 [Brachypodium distachyon]